MKTNVNFLRTLRLAMLAAVVAALTGCASTTYRKGDATAGSLHEAASKLHAQGSALDITVESLTQLVNNPATDLRRQFDFFSDSLDELIKATQRADESIDRLQARSAEHFENWDEELAAMNYGVIRERSIERRIAVSNQVDTVLFRYNETQDVVRPMITYLDDIRKALRTDLTAGGLVSVRDIAAKAGDNARKVQQALDHLTVELAENGKRMSSTIVADDKLNSRVESAGAQGGSQSP